MAIKEKFIHIRHKLIDYPDYFLWLVKKYYFLYYILFGFISMLVLFAINAWLIRIKQNNKQTYIEVYSDTITTLHPLVQSDHILDITAQNLLYLPLLRIDASSEFTSILMNAFSISNTYKDYTITIKNNAKWSDGSKITTQDIAFTYNFIKTYYPNTAVGKALKTGTIKKINDYSIKFQLKNPYVGFIRELTYAIANYKLYKNKTIDDLIQNPYTTNLITSGPYTLDNLSIDTATFTAKANPNFHIMWKYQRTEQTAYFEFISNKADAYVITNNDYNLVQRLKNNPSVILTKYPIIFEIKGIFINAKSQNKFLQDLEYRHALLRILSPSLFANKFDYMPAYSIYPNNTQFFNKTLILNRAKSSNLTQTYKKLNNSTFKLAYLDTTSEQQTAIFIKNYLNQYNVNVILVPINIEDFEYEVLQAHNFDALLYGIKINADPDQSGFWHSKGSLNIVSINDNTIDKLLEQGLTTYNLLERQSVYKQLQEEIISKNTVFIPLFHPNLYVAYHKAVKRLGINTKPAILTSPVERIFTAYPYMQEINTNKE